MFRWMTHIDYGNHRIRVNIIAEIEEEPVHLLESGSSGFASIVSIEDLDENEIEVDDEQRSKLEEQVYQAFLKEERDSEDLDDRYEDEIDGMSDYEDRWMSTYTGRKLWV